MAGGSALNVAAGGAFPWVQAGAMALGPILGSIFPEFLGKTEYQGMDPMKFMNDIILSKGDISQMRSNIINQIKKSTMPAISRVKQVGAAGRLPKGAVLSGIAGVQGESAKAISGVEPALDQAKRSSILDFLGVQNQYASQKGAYDQYNAGLGADMWQTGMGGLGKLITLWQRGLLDRAYIPPAQTGY